MVKRIFEKNQISKNFFTGAHARKGNAMITIEYSVKINDNEENEFMTNVEQSLFEQTLFVLLKCGYIINNITIMKQ